MLETSISKSIRKERRYWQWCQKSPFAIKLWTNETIMALRATYTKIILSTDLQNIQNVLRIIFKYIIRILSIYSEYYSNMQHKFHNNQ